MYLVSADLDTRKKFYQKAIAGIFKENRIEFKEQTKAKNCFRGEKK